MKPVDPLSDDEFARLVRRAAALPDPPEAMTRAAIDLWKVASSKSLQATARSILNRLNAALTFDSWSAGSLAFGVRGVPSDVRHLLFAVEGRDIDVRIAPAAGNFRITGQILGPDESGTVELTSVNEDDRPAARVQAAKLDAMGEFRLDDVRKGAYMLTVRLGDDEIVLPPIDVGGNRR